MESCTLQLTASSADISDVEIIGFINQLSEDTKMILGCSNSELLRIEKITNTKSLRGKVKYDSDFEAMIVGSGCMKKHNNDDAKQLFLAQWSPYLDCSPQLISDSGSKYPIISSATLTYSSSVNSEYFWNCNLPAAIPQKGAISLSSPLNIVNSSRRLQIDQSGIITVSTIGSFIGLFFIVVLFYIICVPTNFRRPRRLRKNTVTPESDTVMHKLSLVGFWRQSGNKVKPAELENDSQTQSTTVPTRKTSIIATISGKLRGESANQSLRPGYAVRTVYGNNTIPSTSKMIIGESTPTMSPAVSPRSPRSNDGTALLSHTIYPLPPLTTDSRYFPKQSNLDGDENGIAAKIRNIINQKKQTPQTPNIRGGEQDILMEQSPIDIHRLQIDALTPHR